MQFGINLLILLLIGFSEEFFNGDVSTLSNGTALRLNLTCFYYDELVTDSEYCVYQYFYNGSSSTVLYDYMEITNIYRSISKRCTGFSDTTDIGFGFCSPLEYELFDISILCICATNMCNMNLTTCKSSVTNQLQTNSAPSVLDSMIPEIITPISCFDETYDFNASSFCYYLASPYIDIEKCNEYTMNNTVLCMFDVIDGQTSPMAITIDYSAYYLSGALFRVNQFNRDWTSTLSYKETPGSFDINFNVTQLYNNTNITIVRQRCFCVENYCNNNITTCLNANTTIPLENSAISK
ncbi:unnamed protein product [Adineta steineri]|uniref:Uncharacterized protein n=1 Tax=Adineta steineri TaxID=433720 RepID=A0A818WIS9_9BILA|nr:unnamed protein product [Adineta steineri]